MRKILFGIFAHPDDEAFGPAGTLLKLKSEGYDIHLILLTDGEAGTNPDSVSELGTVRLEEWKTSTDIVGINSRQALHYPDGGLASIETTDDIDAKVSHIITEILNAPKQAELSFIMFEPQGLTGHRDHIAASGLTNRMTQKERHSVKNTFPANVPISSVSSDLVS